MKPYKAAIIVFLGTNCNAETKRALDDYGFECDFVDYRESSLDKYDAIFLPGGFSYGDYIRSGRLAKFTPAVAALKQYIQSGRGVAVGICNGFQILCEAHLLPGALIENENAKFICKNVPLNLDFRKNIKQILLPIAHKEGRYFADDKDILKAKNMAFLKYSDNPNGSIADIAGLYDKDNRVMGLMPHPERAYFAKNYGFCGRKIFEIIEEEIKRG